MRNFEAVDAIQRNPSLLPRMEWRSLFLPAATILAVFFLMTVGLLTTQMRFSASLYANAEREEVRYRAHAGQQPKRTVPTPADSGECVSRVCLWNRDYLFRFSFNRPGPCEDFYEHACASFRHSAGDFAHQPYPRWSTGQLLLDFDRFFRRFLAAKGRNPRPFESNFLVQAIWVHEKCMTASGKGDALHAWAKILDVLGLSGWPLLKFAGDLVTLVSSGDRYLMLHTLYRVILLRSAHRRGPPQIILKRPLTYLERYVSRSRSATAKRYEDIIVHALNLSGNKTVGDIAGKQILRLEEALQRLTYLDSKHAEYPPNDLWPINTLPKSAHWDWLRYMRLLFKTDTHITESSVVYLEDPLFFTRLSSIFNTTDDETAVANYVGLKALITVSPFMPADYRTLYEFDLGSDIDHFDTQVAACSVLLEKMYRYGVGIAAKLTSNREFANVYRTHRDDQLGAMFNKMRATIRDMLQSRRSWFAKDDIATAQRKLENMTFVFGTQDNFVQYEDYRHTPTLALKSDGVLETVFAIFSYASSIYWSALGNGVGGNVTAAYDNAYTASVFEWGSEYQPTNNLVFAPNGLVGFLSTISSTIPFQLYPVIAAPLLKALLQPLLRSNSLFDDRMSRRKWWSTQSIAAYENVTQCLRRQYEAAENTSRASNATSKLSDVLSGPTGTTRYPDLKAKAQDKFMQSERIRLEQLLTEGYLGDRRPSQLLRRM
ncbi:neprilysin-2-like [Dermacentor variabilis]|uniref:neprilysin-2-like n=1 Tax=Dermacentor variabilis TaxID=34621 RepID=UPI003F5B3680